MTRYLITGGSGFIGTNFVERLLADGCNDLVNIDFHPPKEESQKQYWINADILDAEKIKQIFQEVQPTHVVHLAARTDMEGKTVEDYAANHIGTLNVMNAVKECGSVKRLIVTSSQYVVGPGAVPAEPSDYRPHTIYGESKVLAEKNAIASDPDCVWTIVRPTNVWGKWHPRYPHEFWKVLKSGKYVHPSGKPVVRCYAYVGNLIDQILMMLERDAKDVHRKTFYLGDAPADIYYWVNAFSLALNHRPVRVVPRPVLRSIALVGDLVKLTGKNFPIFSSRYRSMTEDYVTPMDWTFDVFGEPKISLEAGVQETVEWLKTLGSFWK